MIFRRLLVYLWFASYGAAWCWSWGIPSINCFKTWCPYYSVLRRQCLSVLSVSFSTIFQTRLLYCIFHGTYPWSLLSHGLFYRLSQHTILLCYLLFCLILELNRVACSKTWVAFQKRPLTLLFVVALFLSFFRQ